MLSNFFICTLISIGLSVAASFVGAGTFSWFWGLFIAAVALIAVLVMFFSVRKIRPAALKRAMDPLNWWDTRLMPIIALCPVIATFLSASDAVKSQPLMAAPGALAMLGMVLLVSAFLLWSRTLLSSPPSAGDRLDEPDEPKNRGPYELLRFPDMLAALLAGVSIPLIYGSFLGYLALIPMVVAVILRVAREDTYCFTEYEWYLEYTKMVSFRLIPFIW